MTFLRGPTAAILLLAILAAGVGLYVDHRASRNDFTGELAVGTMLPPLPLVDLDSKPASLERWRGKKLLVNFWATWCGPCREEMPALARAQSTYGPSGVQVVGVAQDDADAVRAQARKASPAYPWLVAPTDQATSARAGNPRNLLPYSVLLDERGRVLASHLGRLDEARLKDWLGR